MPASAETTENERILTVPAESVQHLYSRRGFYDDGPSIDSVVQAVAELGEFVDRDVAELDISRIQIVACAFVHNERNMLCLRRSRKSGRDVLRLRHTLLVGGHVSDHDGAGQSVLVRCATRELDEELGLTVETDPPIVGVIADPATDVGLHHLAVVFDVAVSWRELKYDRSCDRSEFTYSNSSGIHSLKTPDAIFRVANKLDPWSSLFLTSQTGRRVLGDRVYRTVHHQMYLSFETQG